MPNPLHKAFILEAKRLWKRRIRPVLWSPITRWIIKKITRYPFTISLIAFSICVAMTEEKQTYFTILAIFSGIAAHDERLDRVVIVDGVEVYDDNHSKN